MTVRGQLVTCLLAVMGVALVAAKGKECGDNPMKQVLLVAKRTGRSLDHVLMVLRDIDTPAYETLARRFRMYAACVGLVDTGYFRKRSEQSASAEPLPEDDYYSGPTQWRRSPGHGVHRQPTGSILRGDVIADYAGGAPSQQIARAESDQLLDDADDVGRSILSLYVKGRQLVASNKMDLRQHGSASFFPRLYVTPDDSSHPVGMTYDK